MTEPASRKGDIQSQWARVRGRLREECGDAAYRAWLKSMTLYGVDEGRVRIGVPTRFLRDWVSQHYSDRIRALWNDEDDAIAAVEILVTGRTVAQPVEAESALPSADGVEPSAATERSEEHTSELQSPVHLVCRLLLEKKNRKQ